MIGDVVTRGYLGDAVAYIVTAGYGSFGASSPIPGGSWLVEPNGRRWLVEPNGRRWLVGPTGRIWVQVG